jgi:hypothetical protein
MIKGYKIKGECMEKKTFVMELEINNKGKTIPDFFNLSYEHLAEESAKMQQSLMISSENVGTPDILMEAIESNNISSGFVMFLASMGLEKLMSDFVEFALKKSKE